MGAKLILGNVAGAGSGFDRWQGFSNREGQHDHGGTASGQRPDVLVYPAGRGKTP